MPNNMLINLRKLNTVVFSLRQIRRLITIHTKVLREAGQQCKVTIKLLHIIHSKTSKSNAKLIREVIRHHIYKLMLERNKINRYYYDQVN